MTEALRSEMIKRDPFTNNSLGFYGADIEIIVTARLYTGNGKVQNFHATTSPHTVGETPMHSGVHKINKKIRVSVGAEGKNSEETQPDYVPQP